MKANLIEIVRNWSLYIISLLCTPFLDIWAECLDFWID